MQTDEESKRKRPFKEREGDEEMQACESVLPSKQTWSN